MAFRNFNILQYSQSIQRPIILDGAMGTMIQEKFPELYVEGQWMNKVLIDKPEFITDCHKQYIEAGANIITTYTFRTNPSTHFKFTSEPYERSRELCKHAVQCAVEARKQCNKQNTVLIAGSDAPSQQCYSKQELPDDVIYESHKQHIKYLMDSGCDLILGETIGVLKEIEAISEICTSQNIPYIISLVCDENLNLISGEPIEEGIKMAQKYKPLAISFNCIFLDEMKSILKRINVMQLNVPWGFYLNCGYEDFKKAYKNRIAFNENQWENVIRQELQKFMEELQSQNMVPSFVGLCCCSQPHDIKNLKEIFYK